MRVVSAILVANVPAANAASIDPVYGAVNDGHAVCALCDAAPKLKSKLEPVVEPLVGIGANLTATRTQHHHRHRAPRL